MRNDCPVSVLKSGYLFVYIVELDTGVVVTLGDSWVKFLILHSLLPQNRQAKGK